MRGKFITLYGINNIGKSTHALLLVENLKVAGYDAVFLKYPLYELEPTGSQINAIIRADGSQNVSEEDLQTLFTRNRKDFEPTLNKMLDDGKIVVAEDYTGTGIAWGTAKGLSLEYMEKLNFGLLKEDFAVLLTGERKLIAREKKHLHETNDALSTKVAGILVALSARYHWHELSTLGSIAETSGALWKMVEEFLSGKNE